MRKRETSKGVHASQFYDPDKIVAGDQRRGVRQGRFNPGVNNLKRAAKTDPAARKQLMQLRRKAQQQGHVTIEKNLQHGELA